MYDSESELNARRGHGGAGPSGRGLGALGGLGDSAPGPRGGGRGAFEQFEGGFEGSYDDLLAMGGASGGAAAVAHWASRLGPMPDKDAVGGRGMPATFGGGGVGKEGRRGGVRRGAGHRDLWRGH